MPDWILQVLAVAAGGVGVYAAIRADLARLHERATIALQRAEHAHDRIDRLHRQ